MYRCCIRTALLDLDDLAVTTIKPHARVSALAAKDKKKATYFNQLSPHANGKFIIKNWARCDDRPDC